MNGGGVVAEQLAVYLECGEGDTPQERGARSGALCDAVSRLIQELMDGQSGWEPRYTWLDGIAQVTINQTSRNGLRLVGGAYVVNGDRWSLRPVRADLSRPPASSRLYFASADAEVPYAPGHEARLVIPSTWPYVFEVDLPA